MLSHLASRRSDSSSTFKLGLRLTFLLLPPDILARWTPSLASVNASAKISTCIFVVPSCSSRKSSADPTFRLQESTRNLTFAGSSRDLFETTEDQRKQILKLLESSHDKEKIEGMKRLIAVCSCPSFRPLHRFRRLTTQPPPSLSAHLQGTSRCFILPKRHQTRLHTNARAPQARLHLHPPPCRVRAGPRLAVHQHLPKGPERPQSSHPEHGHPRAEWDKGTDGWRSGRNGRQEGRG